MNIQTNHVTELSADELDAVNGGIAPILLGYALGFAAGVLFGPDLAM